MTSNTRTVSNPLSIAAVAALVLGAALSPTAAQDGKAYYAGKTVRMIVGSGTGGGYDVFSRMIAPYLAKELGTTVIVENQPGAGGLVAMNRLYVAPAGRPADIAVERRQRGVLAAPRRQGGALTTSPNSPSLPPSARRPDCGWSGRIRRSAKSRRRSTSKQKWRWASSGGTSGLGIGAAFTCEALRLDCHVVQGYKGSADAGLAVTRGEMDALYVPESSANHFRQGEAELGAGDDVANQIALLPGSSDDLRSGEDGCRPDLGDGLPRQRRRSRTHPDRAARHAGRAACIPQRGGEAHAAQSGADRRRRKGGSHRRVSRSRRAR